MSGVPTHGYDHAFVKGERGFNYYDEEWGTVDSEPDDQGWFWVRQDNGHHKTLNNERFVQPAVAQRHGYGADPNPERTMTNEG